MIEYTMQARPDEDSLECLIDGIYSLDFLLSRMNVKLDEVEKGDADLSLIRHSVANARHYIQCFIIEPLGIEEAEGGEDDDTAN